MQSINIKRRIEITTVTEQAVLVRPTSVRAWRWCAGCNAQANLVTPDQAATIARVYMRTIFQWVESGKLHFEETADGKLLVCLNSLGAIMVGTDGPVPIEMTDCPAPPQETEATVGVASGASQLSPANTL